MKEVRENMIDSTSVVSDIRNFTGVFSKYQKNKDRRFLDGFMIPFYKKHMKLAQMISDPEDFYLNNNGDSVIVVFQGSHNYLDGYAFALGMYKILTAMCKDFNKKYNEKLSFGIGIDCGEVWELDIEEGALRMDICLGSVINRSVRIEARTKETHHTNMLVGGNVFKSLCAKLNPILYKDIKKFSLNYDEALCCKDTRNKFIDAGEDLMVFYNFESALKNVGEPLPVFKMLVPWISDDRMLKKLMIRLTDNSYKILKFINEK